MGEITVRIDRSKGEAHFSEMTTRRGVPTPRVYSVVRREGGTVKPPVKPAPKPPDGAA